MQTFLPWPSFAASAAVLDLRRLGKQRVEALQVVRALVRPGYGWQAHPAVRMWRATPLAAASYGLAVCGAWTAGGRPDTCAASIAHELGLEPHDVPGQAELAAAGELPWWLGDDAVHRSHRSALVRKDPAFYRPAFPDVPDDLPYVWPVPENAASGQRARP